MTKATYKLIEFGGRHYFNDGTGYVLVDTGFPGSCSLDGKIGPFPVCADFPDSRSPSLQAFLRKFLKGARPGGQRPKAILSPLDFQGCRIQGDTITIDDMAVTPDVQSFPRQEELLKRICQDTNGMRREAIERELLDWGIGYRVLKEGTLVIPAKKHDRKDIVAVCAHYDVVPGSKGYNDNGMSIVIVLGMLQALPDNVEVVFTNGEESGQTGAREYLKYVYHSLRACVNLDVCGCFDAVYLDPMDCEQAKRLPGCKKGMMPPSDALAFYNEGIPAVCFSTGRADVGFEEGIKQICQTIHGRAMDNDFSMLNFEMIPKVQGKVLELIGRINLARG